jgi:hypothetical protein
MVLADESIDGEGIAQRRADRVIVDLLLIVTSRLHFIPREQNVTHQNSQDYTDTHVLVEIGADRPDLAFVVFR